MGHEHQRSELWKLIGKYVDINKMKLALQTKGGDSRYDDWKEDEHAKDGGSTEDYDPDSIMHYWQVAFVCLRRNYDNQFNI